MGGYVPVATMPWLASTPTLVAVALCEEARLSARLGAIYDEYRARTPLLIPMPRPLRGALRRVVQGVLGKPYPEEGLGGHSAISHAGGYRRGPLHAPSSRPT